MKFYFRLNIQIEGYCNPNRRCKISTSWAGSTIGTPHHHPCLLVPSFKSHIISRSYTLETTVVVKCADQAFPITFVTREFGLLAQAFARKGDDFSSSESERMSGTVWNEEGDGLEKQKLSVLLGGLCITVQRRQIMAYNSATCHLDNPSHSRGNPQSVPPQPFRHCRIFRSYCAGPS